MEKVKTGEMTLASSDTVDANQRVHFATPL
jgi:hypothetical protein